VRCTGSMTISQNGLPALWLSVVPFPCNLRNCQSLQCTFQIRRQRFYACPWKYLQFSKHEWIVRLLYFFGKSEKASTFDRNSNNANCIIEESSILRKRHKELCGLYYRFSHDAWFIPCFRLWFFVSVLFRIHQPVSRLMSLPKVSVERLYVRLQWRRI
jgi:hypothetical protein